MTRLVVVEARRLLPVLVLFLLLAAVSLYDGLSAPAKPALTEPNSAPYRTLIQTTPPENVRSAVVTTLDAWVAIHTALGLELGEYDFNPRAEVAVFLFNCQLVSTRSREGAIEMTVRSEKGNCQLVLFSKSQLPTASPQFMLMEASGKKY